MPPDAPTGFGGMPAAEVVAVVEWLESQSIVYQVNGGWAVDALGGRQTRTHRDVDVFVDARALPRLRAALQERGYEVAQDQLPVRIEYVAGTDRVDVHPMEMQAGGDGLQQGMAGETYRHRASDRVHGVIGTRPVVVASAARLMELRQGYDPRPEDVHDLRILRRLTGDAD